MEASSCSFLFMTSHPYIPLHFMEIIFALVSLFGAKPQTSLRALLLRACACTHERCPPTRTYVASFPGLLPPSPLRMLASDNYAWVLWRENIISRDACRDCHKASLCGAVKLGKFYVSRGKHHVIKCSRPP